MKRILLPPEYSGESEWNLTGKDFHHLIRVSRHKKEDSFKATDVSGRMYVTKIGEISDSHVTLMIEKDESLQEERSNIILVQSLTKGKAMDLIIRQSAEAGVSCIIPVFTKYSVVKLETEKETKNKIDRWVKIAREACIQSGSPVIPEIKKPQVLERTVFGENALILYFHQEPEGNAPLHNVLVNDYKSIYILIGPEGGFSDDEVRHFSQNGYTPVYLGQNVLRAETAALYAIASVTTVLREKDTWRKK